MSYTKTMSDYSDETDAAYKVGDTVPLDGYYTCVPCGNKKYLKQGTRFGSCLKCLSKQKGFFQKGLELWERVITIKKRAHKE